MAVEEVKEGITNPQIPLIGEVDGVTTVVAIVAGLVLMNLIEPASENIAERISAFITNMTGYDLESGQQSTTGGAFD